jgi:hypothetical protein
VQGRFATIRRRLLLTGALVAGLLLGSACLAVALLLASSLIPDLSEGTAQVVGGVSLSLLALGDTWSLARSRPLYPFGARRQTAQSLMFGRQPEATVGLVWGVDAGFGLATYRSTSGLWVVSCLAILGLSPWWTVIGYGAGFAATLTLVMWTPASGDDGETRAAAAASRIERLIKSGGAASRVAYLAVLLAAIVVLVWR